MDLMKPGALSSRVSSMVSPSCWILGSMWVREQQRWADRREWSGVSREGDTSDSTMGSKEIARRLSFLSLSWVTGTSEVRMKARLELTRLAEVLEVRSSFNPSSPSDLTVWEKWPSLARSSCLARNHDLRYAELCLRHIRPLRQMLSWSRAWLLQLGLVLLLPLPLLAHHRDSLFDLVLNCLLYSRDGGRLLFSQEVLRVVDDLNYERATGASGHFLPTLQLLLCDGKPVSAGTRIVIGLLLLVELEIFNFYCVVKDRHGGLTDILNLL